MKKIKKGNISFFYLESKFFDCFCDDWNIFVCETCFPFMTFLFCVYTNPNLKTKKNNACKDLRTFKAIKKEINREICQKLSTKQLGSKQKRSSFTFLWLIATILCLIKHRASFEYQHNRIYTYT